MVWWKQIPLQVVLTLCTAGLQILHVPTNGGIATGIVEKLNCIVRPSIYYKLLRHECLISRDLDPQGLKPPKRESITISASSMMAEEERDTHTQN